MSGEEQQPDSLAAQAAAWVPPWERKREPDREYQASVDEPEEPDESDEPGESGEPGGSGEPGAPSAPEAEPEQEAASGQMTVPAQPRGPRDAPVAPVEGVARTPKEDLTAPSVMDDAELAGALESILLVVDEPTGELQLAQVLEQPVERIARTLERIAERYSAAGHGIDLRRAAGGWRLYTRPEYAQYVERFVLDGQSVRLTQAALETLSVVAYKQPVTRSRISAIRGVNCDGVMRTLVTRGLIEECGTEPETGAYLYRTTSLFLEKLGLNSVDQLPPLAPFLPDDVEEVLDASG
ncbi:SMC-Scp complex subunit ScpB [Actinoplanes rectilineatus]|uniref:SMC-Scp complex subunit ScpB n=1 Tax=Actinoplanes rectilineatus TaxID=113571 RepID=UPI0005F2F4AD|nr:SMC-Scp complex subunit ScpB [Actinoplanes rectilineatus]